MARVSSARRLRALGLALLLGVGGAAGCSREVRPAVRTVLFAVDGLEWSVLWPMLAAGRLPTLARLMAEGRYGQLQTLEPTSSPVIWTTIATGRLPRVHGITGFEHAGADGARVLFSSHDRRAPAFWNILSAEGRRVESIGWWLTHPVEPIEGVMVAQTNTASRADVATDRGIRKGTLIPGAAGQVFPQAREAEFFEVAREVEAGLDAQVHAVFGAALDGPDPHTANLFRSSLWALRADAIYAAIALRLAPEPADLLAVYFGGTDVVGHRFWRYHEPERFEDRPTPESVAQLGQVIRDYYAWVDGRMGAILAALPPRARVLVVSDHGMEAYRTDARFPPDALGRDLLSGHHFEAQPGVFVAAGPGIARGGATDAEPEPVGNVLDVLPTLLALLELPLAEDMPGRPMATVLEPDVLAAQPARVATYATAAWQAARAERAAEPTPAVDPERVQQLRELGYVE